MRPLTIAPEGWAEHRCSPLPGQALLSPRIRNKPAPPPPPVSEQAEEPVTSPCPLLWQSPSKTLPELPLWPLASLCCPASGQFLLAGKGQEPRAPGSHAPPSQAPLCFGHEEQTQRTRGFREPVQT